ncbi:MAG: hypothetical protein H5T74_09450 [Actinobacteria bacterium]|nr:hypothetical protein [Actinomycetota bacterium]MDI6830393.1 hypothetical protein [Actinomycetota bacterium]
MQKKDAKGFFIDSRLRGSGLLKTLLRGFRHRQEGEEERKTPYEYGRPGPRETASRGRDSGEGMKKAASL